MRFGRPRLVRSATIVYARRTLPSARELIDCLPEIVFETDQKLRFTFVNRHGLELTGYDETDLERGVSILDVAALDGGELTARLTELVRGERIGSNDYVLRKKDGTTFPVVLHAEPIREGGVFVGVRGVAIDVSEIKRADKAERDNERSLDNVLDAIQDGITVLAADLTVLRVNRGLERLYPDRVPFEGKKCYAVFHGRHEACEVCPTKRAISTGRLQMDVHANVGPDGIRGYVEIFAHPRFDSEGRAVGAVEYVRDITVRVRAERALAKEKELLSVTLRSLGEGVVTTDAADRVILVNRAAEELTGALASDLVGKALEDVLPLGRIDAHAVETVVRLGPERCEVPISASRTPMLGADGTLLGHVIVFRDVTARRKAEESIRTAQKLEALGMLAGGIAHDFNNLLCGLFGYVEVARAMVSSGRDPAPALMEAAGSMQRARDLTQQLLTFSKGGVPAKTPVDVGDLLRETVRFALGGSEVHPAFDIAPDLPCCDADRNQIAQVIDNIVINAKQATPEGGTVLIAAREVVVDETMLVPLRPGRYVRLTVRDHGVGISRPDLPRIFDPFFTTKREGTGLGLATSYSIVKRHDGHIEVESDPGSGTTMSVYLPVADGPAAVRAAIEPRPARVTARVLVMDDEASVRQVLCGMLREIGSTCEAVSDGQHALELLCGNSGPFDAAILDLTVRSGWGGKETVREMARLAPRTRPIVMTGYSDDPVMAAPERYGFLGVLRKPFSSAELATVLGAALAR
jgi:PAS domain S-box-containing protein